MKIRPNIKTVNRNREVRWYTTSKNLGHYKCTSRLTNLKQSLDLAFKENRSSYIIFGRFFSSSIVS